jgi:toxin ParE1/3/4
MSAAKHDAEYIAADSPAYAKAVVKNITDQTRSLSRFPRLGRKAPEFDDDSISQLLVYSYRVIYRIETEVTIITAVVHGKRDLPA